MKKLNFLMIALVAVLGLSSCEKDCNHDFIEHDFTQDIVGTWTFLNGDLAEAMVIKADGSFTTTGVARGGSLYEEKGTIKVVNNKVTLAFDGDNETFEGRLEFVAGKSMSFVMFNDNDVRLTYDYCKEDLSEEIVGMWVCNDFTTDGNADMMIETFYDNGKFTLTGFPPMGDNNEQILDGVTDYKVVGDLLIIKIPAEKNDGKSPLYVANKLIYTPDGTAHGDILTMNFPQVDGEFVAAASSWLRVKQSLNLVDKVYAYNTAYVTNAKGKDEDFSIMGHTFNIAKLKANDFDVMFGFLAEFPNSNTMKHRFYIDGEDAGFDAKIAVEGNKVSIDMSFVNPALRKIEMYMFQDKDDTQLHMYMPTSSFINYFANMELYALILEGKIDQTDEAAIAKVFTDMEARVESINVSFVFKALK